MRTFLFRSEAGIDHYMIQEGDKTFFEAVADVAPVLEQNKAMAAHNDGYSPSRELRRVASIPYAIGYKWLNEEGWWFMDPAAKDKLAQKLNSSEYAYLRTAEGRVGVSNGVLR